MVPILSNHTLKYLSTNPTSLGTVVVSAVDLGTGGGG